MAALSPLKFGSGKKLCSENMRNAFSRSRAFALTPPAMTMELTSG